MIITTLMFEKFFKILVSIRGTGSPPLITEAQFRELSMHAINGYTNAVAARSLLWSQSTIECLHSVPLLAPPPPPPPAPTATPPVHIPLLRRP